MRRLTSALAVAAVSLVVVSASAAAEENRTCRFDSDIGRVACFVDGIISTPAQPGSSDDAEPDPGKRFVYTTTDATVGDCYFWSNVAGGLDAWNPANETAVLVITSGLPLCPAVVVPPVDARATAWQIFRSWDLNLPEPVVTPTERGITGIATHVAVVTPDTILYTEVLPDGRTLEVRARTTTLLVDWGDGSMTSSNPATATGYPEGSASHIYERKTCTAQYRVEHPSGGLCHPSAEYYPIIASFVWAGEFTIGAGWQLLGDLTVSAEATNYDVDESRGITTP